MLTITVCVGSSCHLKGAHEFIEFLKNEIEDRQLYNEVELKGSFCMGHCTEGVNVKFDEELISIKSLDELKEHFRNKALNAIETNGRK